MFAFLFLLIIGLISLLHLPYVQTKLTNTLGEYVYSKTGYALNIGSVDISWYDVVKLENVDIKDLDGQQFISASSAQLDLRLSGLTNRDQVILDDLYLHEPKVALRWNYEENLLNMTLFSKTLRETFAGKKKSQKKKIKPVIISNIQIENGTLTYHMDHRPYMNDSLRFDHNHFELDSISGHLTNFYLFRDTIAVQGDHITLFENKTNLHIQELTTNFLYCKHAMEFDSVTLRTDESIITEFVRFESEGYSSYGKFVDSIYLKCRLDSTVISTNELALFAPPIRQFEDQWIISSIGEGYVRDFDLYGFNLSFGKRSHIYSERLALDGIPNLLETEIRIDVNDAYLTQSDLDQYIPNGRATRTLKKLGNIKFSADFRGYPLDFVAHGNFHTSIGSLKTDLRFYPDPADSIQRYNGHLKTTRFQLGDFMNEPSLGLIDMNGSINGEGFNMQNADVLLTASVDRLEYKNHAYRLIQFDTARLRNGFFNGGVTIRDPQLDMRLLGKIDFNNERVKLKSKINSMNLMKLDLAEDSISVGGIVDCNFSGFELDSIIGRINVNNGHIANKNQRFGFNHFDLITSKTNGIRDIALNSSIADIDVRGNFLIEPALEDLRNLYNEYELSLLNDNEQLEAYYDSLTIDSSYATNITFSGEMKNINPLLSILAPDVQMAQQSYIHGEFSIDTTNKSFDININAPFFEWNGLRLNGSNLEFSSSKSINSNDLISHFDLRCEEVSRFGQHYVDSTIFEGNWGRDSLAFLFKSERRGGKEGVLLDGIAHFLPDTVLVNLHNSSVKILDKLWKVNESNELLYTNKSLRLKDLDLTTHKEKISAHGILDKINGHGLHLDLENFRLKNIQDFVAIPLDGSVTGSSVLSMGEHGDLLFQSNASVKNIQVYGDHIGDLKGKFIWDAYEDKLIIQSNYYINDVKTARLEGFYDINNTLSPMSFVAKFKETPTKVLEPFLQGYATNIGGFGTGKLDISGTFQDPNFQGKLFIQDGAFTIDYLKTRYGFSAPIYFNDDWIGAKNLTLVDSVWQTTGLLNGGITHKMFKKFHTDASLKLKNTFILNTGPEDNSLYYGQAFGTGTVNIEGPFKEIKINSEQLTSNKGTRIHIPLEGTETIVEQDYIQFIDPNKEDIEEEDKKIDLSGIVMDVNLNITPDAYMEIIFDEKAGDIMRGYGNGQLQLQIDTRGDFNMLGQYVIDKGAYNFTLVNLINKRFEVSPNSSITWSGDPYKGILDINASYKQYASIIPIVDTTIYDLSARTEFYRNYPVEISLQLENELLKPEVSFDVKIQEYPASIEDVVESFHSRLSSDEQEKNKQVFTLVVLKQLSPPGSFGDLESGSYSSLSELFSNQFSHWLSQFDENLEVDIDLSGFDETNNANFNLRLSYSVLDGRIRITQNNDFQNMDDPSNLTNVFGEWTIEYLITDDGQLKLKAYNKADQSNVINDLNSSTSTIYGASLTHTANFDKLSDLFRRNPNKYEMIERDDESEEEEENSEDEDLEEDLLKEDEENE